MEISSLFPRLSYFRKQLLVVIGVNFVSLALAAVLLYSSFMDDYRDSLLAAMGSKVEILSSTSASALLFDDNQAAQRLLDSLHSSGDTRFAQIYSLDGNLFAEYRRDGLPADMHMRDMSPGSVFIQDRLYILEPISLDNEVVGHILISADTAELVNQQNRYSRIVLGVFVFSLLVAYVLNWRLQSVLTAPINKLAELVAHVAHKREYHRRLSISQEDEIGSLMSGVNGMLDTIEQHEKQLQDHSDRLESLVALRTEQLFQRANYDALTQLPNRHLLIDRLNHGIDNADREHSSLALMFLDLDRFKVINDSLGHSIGDLLLNQVADTLVGLVNKADSVCRWGGDEFVILVEHLRDRDAVETLARQIIQALQKPMTVSGHQLHISTSIGIACYPYDGADSMTLLKHADISMYRAKDRGPGQLCFFDSAMLDDSVQRLSMESQLRGAIERDEFFLVYQPQMCMHSGALCGMEALIRWQTEDGLVSPNQFLMVAEEIGMINGLSEWVIREACRQYAEWLQQGLNISPVAVNLPAAFIVLPQCTDIIKSILEDTGLPAEYLEIEITENTFVASTDTAIHSLQSLKNLGIGIAIDDFGTGYSCMSYLRDLPVSKLKVDGSFVQQLGDSEANDGIVQSIITLGKSLQLTVVGECIELERQKSLLKVMGCDMAQGYLYSKPLAAHDAKRFISDQ